MSTNKLFVYGTLRPEYGGGEINRTYLTGCKDLGLATVQGVLYNLSWFPGLKRTNDPSRHVIGHVYEIPSVTLNDVIQGLDQFEGFNPLRLEHSLFVRGEIIAIMESDKSEVSCQTYFFARFTREAIKIESGDFVNPTVAEIGGELL